MRKKGNSRKKSKRRVDPILSQAEAAALVRRIEEDIARRNAEYDARNPPATGNDLHWVITI